MNTMKGIKHLRRLAPAILVAFCFATPLFAKDAPSWLRQASSTTVPSYDSEVPAVVLHDEQRISVNSDGKLSTTQNYALKVLTREGRRLAVARAFYLVSAGKVRDIDAWVIRPDGSVKEFDKKSVLDIISDPDDIYDEGRIKVIDGSNDVDLGYVFGYTVVSEESALFFQDQWAFQDRLPVRLSRYVLDLPSGWSANSTTFNAAELKPAVSGSNYAWEMRDLAPIKPEPMSPSVANLSPRIAVNFVPDAKGPTSRNFANWVDVSKWASSLHDPQAILDDAVAAKARELAADAKSELEIIRAIGAYAQGLQYISIDIGVGHGNGYKPRPSTTVLSRGYGDCKDKANLMRALLKAMKIDAYPVAIYSGDPSFVREEWASPRQFNHCIIAVRVSDATKAAPIVEHPTLGRLLMFDATDPYTPVGDLPDHLQGSFGLVAAGDKGGLVRMPVSAPDRDVLKRQVSVSLNADGSISGTIAERAEGQVASYFRREHRELAGADYQKALEGWLTRGATGARILKYKALDRPVEVGFDLDLDFSAPRYAQVMQGRLFVFRPVLVGRRNDISVTAPTRSAPIEIESVGLNETATFALPDGFVVDETPEAMKLKSPFGEYTTTFEIKGQQLIFKRRLVTKRSTLPAESYESVRSFYSKIREAEQSPVVLIRK